MFFEYHVRISFDVSHPIDFLWFLRKFVVTYHRLDITVIESFVII